MRATRAHTHTPMGIRAVYITPHHAHDSKMYKVQKPIPGT